MKRIITINSNQVPKSIETRNLLNEKLIAAGFDVYYDFHPGTELIISIGGDGSFLKTVHDFNFPKIPIVGINTGHLGFFPEICPDNIDSFIETYLQNGCFLQGFLLLCLHQLNVLDRLYHLYILVLIYLQVLPSRSPYIL